MTPTRAALALALVALPPGPAVAGPPDLHRRDLLGRDAPELVAQEVDWLGGPPTNLAALRGKVVWLQFNF